MYLYSVIFASQSEKFRPTCSLSFKNRQPNQRAGGCFKRITDYVTRFAFSFSGPKIIIYDNCCALHAYCLNRDPLFFKHTTFLIDRFHWRNHTGKKQLPL